MSRAWIGVDLDGTLAHYEGYRGGTHIGEPIPLMLERVKAWLAEGKLVKIFTARAWTDGSSQRDFEVSHFQMAIDSWCMKHIGQHLPITCRKDFSMIELWDDRCVQVIPNTGQRADGKE